MPAFTPQPPEELLMRALSIPLAALLLLVACSDTTTTAPTSVDGLASVTNFANAPQGAHYAQGQSEPVCTLSGLTVSCTSTAIAGVGNTNATVSLAVTSTFTGVCRNPGTNNKVVDPFTESETTTTSAQLFPSRNGRLDVPAQSATGTSSAQFLANFTCPNPRWTPEVTGTAISFVYTLTFAGFTQPAIRITG
jgi:hypothetical protein